MPTAASQSPAPPPPFDAVERLLAEADLAGILAQELGPLAAHRLRRLGQRLPDALATEERRAQAAWLTAVPLLGRIRTLVDGPLLLLKGPEIASLYPGRARSFLDLDLLSADARRAHAALTAAGFAEVDDPELFRDHHHLRPLQPPGLWLKVELHERPPLPPAAASPRVEELIEASVPSALGIDGLSAPCPAHHAPIVAAHAWVHEPLGSVRDLLDVAALARQADVDELRSVARAWGIERIWRTTEAAAHALFGGGRPTLALRLFGRHLPTMRERTVLENHLQRWLHFFWEQPLNRALASTSTALRQELLPEPGEPWRVKLVRVRSAILHAGTAMSAHTASWRRQVEGGDARGRRGGRR